MKNKTERNSSIELLRIIAIMGVVILHYNYAGMGGGFKYVSEGSINQLYLYFSESIFICAVDLFVMISAFYLSNTKKRNMIKIVELNIQVIVFRVIEYMLTVLINGYDVSIKQLIVCMLPINYFVILYSVLYIISPYINILIENITKKELKKLILLLVAIFSVWTFAVDFIENVVGVSLNGLSTVGVHGSQQGYSIVNFVLIYFIGAYIRKNEVKMRTKKLIIIIASIICAIFALSLIEHKMGLNNTTTWNYNNPLIIVLAAAILLLFMNYSFNNKVINELARGAFTCFLFHSYFVTKVNVIEFVNKPFVVLIIHQICVAVALYLVSYIAYKIYTLCSGWFIKLITPLVNKMDISIK